MHVSICLSSFIFEWDTLLLMQASRKLLLSSVMELNGHGGDSMLVYMTR